MPELLGTAAAARAGTLWYMAPEQISGAVGLGEAYLLDVYALGVMAYELLTGELPFDGSTQEVIAAHAHLPVPSVRALRPELPLGLGTLVDSMLAKHALDRPAGMDVIAWRLRELRTLAPLAARRPFDVLVVDDDADVLAMLCAVVREAVPHARIRTAADGDEAVRLATVAAPDLMLLDLDLPKMNGLEVALTLRGTRVADACAIVTVSGRASQQDVRLLRDLGLTEFVAKDFEAHRKLIALARKHFQKVSRAPDAPSPSAA